MAHTNLANGDEEDYLGILSPSQRWLAGDRGTWGGPEFLLPWIG